MLSVEVTSLGLSISVLWEDSIVGKDVVVLKFNIILKLAFTAHAVHIANLHHHLNKINN